MYCFILVRAVAAKNHKQINQISSRLWPIRFLILPIIIAKCLTVNSNPDCPDNNITICYSAITSSFPESADHPFCRNTWIHDPWSSSQGWSIKSQCQRKTMDKACNRSKINIHWLMTSKSSVIWWCSCYANAPESSNLWSKKWWGAPGPPIPRSWAFWKAWCSTGFLSSWCFQVDPNATIKCLSA